MALFLGRVLVDGILNNVVDSFSGSTVIETLSSGTELTDMVKFFTGSVVILSVSELTDIVELCTSFVMVVILFCDTDVVEYFIVSVLVVVPVVIESSIEVEVWVGFNSIAVVVDRVSNEVCVSVLKNSCNYK